MISNIFIKKQKIRKAFEYDNINLVFNILKFALLQKAQPK